MKNYMNYILLAIGTLMVAAAFGFVHIGLSFATIGVVTVVVAIARFIDAADEIDIDM